MAKSNTQKSKSLGQQKSGLETFIDNIKKYDNYFALGVILILILFH